MKGRSRIDVGALLAAAEAASPVDAIEAVADALRDTVAAEQVSFLIADFSGDSLIRLGHSSDLSATRRAGPETAERVALTGTAHGRALRQQAVEVVHDDGGAWLYAPVTSRGEAVGVLEVRVADRPDDQTIAEIAQAGHALAYIVIANRRYTDLFEWGQRSVPLSLAAEIQHRLLPGSYTCEGGQFTLAAWLEPAGEVGGDTFDFALGRDKLFFSLTDAMGHTVNAALLATLMIGSIRNGRRQNADLAKQASLADEALSTHAGGSQFVTGQLVCIDLVAGAATIVNAGHPPPLRLRDGVVDEVPLDADPPFGAMSDTTFHVQALPLEPGDRLLFVTDGVLERDAADADIHSVIAGGRDDHPREAVQHVIQAAMRASGDELSDDATALCLDWHGGPRRKRRTDAGANVDD
ncbi:MAG TPA: PP2C family protein-serine/threonine phosphatase [Solirubrobacteraceae bacterium]|jgi:serine phosphatase RsbU (regulator of sigma subunit)